MKKLLYFVPSIIYYMVIFLLSSRDLGSRLNRYGLDKAAHVVEFGLFAFLLAIGFFNVLKGSLRAKTAAVLVTGLVLACLDEFHQIFVRGRVADIRDWLADAVGLTGGIMVFRYLLKKMKPTEQEPDPD
jgi:VanZ family protein